MKNHISWQRALIALLLLLNALPFSFGWQLRPNVGILWAIAGWALLSWPILAESFFGPEDNSRKLGFFDCVKLIISACLLFFTLAIPEDNSMARITFLTLSFVLIFIPISPDSKLTKNQENALYHLECISDLGYKVEPEYTNLENDILKDSKK